MPCDFGRPFFVKLGLVVLLGGPAMLPVAAQTSARQQEQDRPGAPPILENSIDRWNRMSPDERERELAKLPPARARLIRQRIRRYNQMSPAEQQALRERYQAFSQLPPQRKQVIRQRLREYRQLPQERHPPVHAEVVQLRQMPEAQRQARLNSDEFRSKFSPQEQQIIRDLTSYLPE